MTDQARQQQKDERYVRERWEHPALWFNHVSECWTVTLGSQMHECDASTLHEAWAAAAEFTRQHEQKIAEVEQEIAMCNRFIGYREHFISESRSYEVIGLSEVKEYLALFQRIVTKHLEPALADLKRGWKGQTDGR